MRSLKNLADRSRRSSVAPFLILAGLLCSPDSSRATPRLNSWWTTDPGNQTERLVTWALPAIPVGDVRIIEGARSASVGVIWGRLAAAKSAGDMNAAVPQGKSDPGEIIEAIEFTLNPNGVTPLAGVLVVKTNGETRLKTTLKGQDGEDLVVDQSEYRALHRIPVLGLYPASTNELFIETRTADGLGDTARLFVLTSSLPDAYPTIEVLVSKRPAASSGMILLNLVKYVDGLVGDKIGLPSIVDKFGKVRWLYTGEFDSNILTRLANGSWIIQKGEELVQIDMLGNMIGQTWKVPDLHHDVVELPNGNFLALSAGKNSVDDVVVEVERSSGDIIDRWDLKNILDVDRPTRPSNPDAADWVHLNGLDYDEETESIIVSGRNQSAVARIDKKTKRLVWLLADHDGWKPGLARFLLRAAGEWFEWPWGQHSPKFNPTDKNRVLIFDNGTGRGLPERESYSRAVEFEIDDQRMEIRQVWEFGKARGSELWSTFIGGVSYLANSNNRLVCFGGITKHKNGNPVQPFDRATDISPDDGRTWAEQLAQIKSEVRVVEVSEGGDVVLEIRIKDKNAGTYAGYRSYRAEGVSLYP